MKRRIGQQWEKTAESFLRKQGLTVITRNYHCKQGEIDLVMLDGDALVFIEVRYRQNSSYGSGAQTVTRSKQLKIIATARHFLLKHPRYSQQPCRFDVISIENSQQHPNLDWIRDAFTT